MSVIEGASRPARTAAAPGLRAWWLTWRPSIRAGALAAAVLAVVAEVAALLFAGGLSALTNVLAHPETVLTVWRHYDAVWYLNIAADGYPAHAHDPSEAGSFGDATAFPPLHPLAIRGLAMALHIPILAAAMLLSALALPLALAVFHRLATTDAGQRRARFALLLLVTTPAAFFLVAPYGAGMLLALVAGALLAARRQNWAVAGILGALCMLDKLYAGLVVAAIFVEYMQAHDWKRSKVRADAAWIVAPSIAGLAAWSGYLWATFGDPLRFLHAEAAWDRHLTAPWTTIAHGVDQVTRYWGSNSIALVRLLEVVAILGLLGLTVFAWRRMRRSDAVFMGLSLLAISSSGIVDSAHRYLLAIAPVYVAMAMLLGRRGRLITVAVSLALSAFLLQRFVTGAWAG
ncbi:MAG TPA: glycosyltransferase family 39 protein [Candidatus Angelobacter sp.]|nr:glycosyltransferase family 39 protein [Candidatus Angelobacter sp.]